MTGSGSGTFHTREDKALMEEVRAMRQRLIDDAEQAVTDALREIRLATDRLDAAELNLRSVKAKYGSKK